MQTNAHLDVQVRVVEVGVGCDVSGGPAGRPAIPLAVVCRRHTLQVCIRAAAKPKQCTLCGEWAGQQQERNKEKTQLGLAGQEACSQGAGGQQAAKLVKPLTLHIPG